MHFVFAGICARPAEVESEHAYACLYNAEQIKETKGSELI